jgi:hypothetical protein
LAVVTVIIGSDQRSVNVHGVRDGFAKAVSGKRHIDGIFCLILTRYLEYEDLREGRANYLRGNSLPATLGLGKVINSRASTRASNDLSSQLYLPIVYKQ